MIGPALRAGAPIARGRLLRALSHLSVDHFREHLPLRRKVRSPPAPRSVSNATSWWSKLTRPLPALIGFWIPALKPPPGQVRFVGFRLLALKNVLDPGDNAAGPVLELGADLIVRGWPK